MKPDPIRGPIRTVQPHYCSGLFSTSPLGGRGGCHSNRTDTAAPGTLFFHLTGKRRVGLARQTGLSWQPGTLPSTASTSCSLSLTDVFCQMDQKQYLCPEVLRMQHSAWEALSASANTTVCSSAHAGAGVSGSVTLTKCLLRAKHGPWSIPRQYLTEPSVEATKEPGSADPLQRGTRSLREGEELAGLPPRPGQRQRLLEMQVPGPPFI